MNIMFSIIVPVFNTSPALLDKCFKCIENQPFEDYEVILVNDKSVSKDTIEFMENYTFKKNWKVINHNKNLGLGMARNTGIDNASGNFVLFVDSDDWIRDDYLQNLFAISNEYKIDEFLSFNFNWVYSEKTYKNEKMYFEIENKRIFGIATAWSKIYNRNFLNKNNIRFAKVNLTHEDEYWFLLLLMNTKSFLSADIPIYFYNKTNAASIMNSLTGIKSINAMDGYLGLFLEFYKNTKLNDNTLKYLKKMYAYPLYVTSIYKGVKYKSFKNNIASFKKLGEILYREKRLNIVMRYIYSKWDSYVFFYICLIYGFFRKTK